MSDRFPVGHNLGFISVRVSNSPFISDHTEEDQCALWNSTTFPVSSAQTLQCDHVMNGTYVSIQKTVGESTYTLTLCEVEVMGNRIYSKY